MAQAEKTLVLTLAEGITESVAEEVAGGVVTQSDNTRLSVLKGSCVRRPAINALSSVLPGSVCGGMANADDGSTILYFKPEIGQQRVYDTYMASVRSTLIWNNGQNGYFPYPLDLAEGLTGLQGYQPAVTADAAGNIWTLCARVYDTSGEVALFVSVSDPDGLVIAPSCRITVLSTPGWPAPALKVFSWCGLTSHGANGIAYWYQNDGELRGGKLALDIGTLDIISTLNSPILNPATVNKSLGQVYYFSFADVCTDPEDSQYAYVVSVASSAATACAISKVDVTTMSVVSTTTLAGRFTSGILNQQHMAASAWTYGGTKYLCVMTSDRTLGGGAAVGTVVNLFNASTMASLWSATPLREGYVAPLPYVHGGQLYVVTAITNPNLGSGSTIGTSSEVLTRFQVYNAAGVLQSSNDVFWHKLAARAAYHKISEFEIYPYFPLQVEWNMSAALTAPTDVAFVSDPSIEVYTLSDHEYAPTPVMRCAVDRAARKDGPQNAGSCSVVGSKLYLSYLEDKTEQAYSDGVGLRARYARFDLSPTTQPTVVQDSGVAIVGASLPAVWDGNETMEYSPLHQPKIHVELTGGTGPVLTGTYGVTAVVSFRDRAGMLRCQACATPKVVTLAGTSPRVYVTRPATMRNGQRQDEFEIVVYMTQDVSSGGSSLFFAQNMEPSLKNANGCWLFSAIPTPTQADIVLDTTGAAGQVLQPECPPPAWDLCVGNDRLWIVDAENRFRLLPSMTKRAWRPYEFSGVLEINVPTSHGKIVAVANNSGTVCAFTERGIWAITGYGPDNTAQQGEFSSPQLLSNMGCRSRESVVQVPGVGILFQATDGVFALIRGTSIERFETIDSAYDVGVPGVLMADNEVVYPVEPGALWLVFNWQTKAWTKWPYAEGARRISATATRHTQLAGSNEERSRILQYAPSSGAIEYVDSDTVSGSAGMTVVRGWIAPEGPHGDCVIREIWFHARRNAGHGIRIRVAFDYNESGDLGTYVERSWSSAELADLTYDGRYTVAVNLHATPSRAIKVTVSEIVSVDVSPDAMNPLSLTVFYGVNAGARRRTLKAGALK